MLLVGKFHAVAGDARKDRLPAPRASLTACTRVIGFGGLGRRDHRLRREVERDAEDVGILDVEQAFVVELIGLAAQGAADHLLAEELRAEGADAQDVGDGVRVPALGQHRDRDDAADLLAEPALLADRVHDLAEQIGVGDLLDLLLEAPARSASRA